MAVVVFLPSIEDTLHLGSLLAEALPQAPPYPALLLEGDLGAGKTTLVRGFVENLPGHEEADVASPSFTLMHLYPTRPECAHFDVYRLEGQEPDASLCEALADEERVVLVEWAQFLPARCLPECFLRLTWNATREDRHLELTARGAPAEEMLQRLESALAASRAASS